MEKEKEAVATADDINLIELLDKSPKTLAMVAAAYVDGMKAGALMKESCQGEEKREAS
ncbi:MAG: hypothetical protein IJ516_05765 [Phascolarctobacterium sp.]|nr:hypothetical protein [Phascolarctobacterium sp.]